MAATPKPRHASVQFADPAAPSGREVSPEQFLRECRGSALARFRRRAPSWVGCRTIEHPVPALPGTQASTGMIVAHVSPAVCRAWEETVDADAPARRAHVEEQVHLALQDLSDQDMHGYLALTHAQCELFGPDLVQLTNESLDRTSFSHLGRRADPRWEGTLVERVRPPYLVLIVSIDFEDARAAAPPKRAGKPKATVPGSTSGRDAGA